MTNTELEKLRKKLPRGYGKKIAAITNETRGVVYRVLTGEFNNDSIIDAALKLALEKAEMDKKKKQLIKKL
jgi:hypothetical protein